MSKSKIFSNKLVLFIVLVLAIALAWRFLWHRAGPANPSATGTTQQTFDTTKYSHDEPSSLWVVVNKQRSLPATYTPAGLRAPGTPLRLNNSSPEMLLRPEAVTATEKLVAAAKTDGINLMLVSGYRSYDLQKIVYGSYVKQNGQTEADKTSARPGHSEHQTGLAADLGTTDRKCELEACFGQTAAGQWIAANGYKYGFVLRYAKDTQAIVGYEYEPWHLRYVGTDLATAVHASGKTLEEFFSLPAAPDY